MKLTKSILKISMAVLLMVTFHGCTPYYGLGNNGVDPIVFIKPVFADSSRVTTYIGGKYTHTTDSAYNHKNEVNYFGQLNWSQTHTTKNYNYSFGVFGYLGSYKVAAVENYNGNKPYYGGGLSGEFCVNIPLDNVDLRLIGMKGSLYYENGDFTRFRKTASELNLISGVSSSQFAYNISLTSGLEFNLKKGSFGFDGSSGMTYFIKDKPAFLTYSLNAHYTYKRCTAYVLFTESVFGIGEEYALGFAYRL